MRLALLAHALAVCSALQLQPSRPVLHASCAPRTNGVFAGRKGRPSGQQLGMQGQQMGGPKGPPEDGSSLFYLYCRAERKDLWYPVSVLQSDSQAPTPPTAHRSPPTRLTAHIAHRSPPTPARRKGLSMPGSTRRSPRACSRFPPLVRVRVRARVRVRVRVG